MRQHFKTLSSVTLSAFVLAMLMACCWQKIISSHGQLAKASHLPACHQQSPDKAQKASSEKPCECPQLMSIIPDKSFIVMVKESGYLKWIFESPSKASSVTLYSFPTTESSMGGPPFRYAFLTPLYIKNSVLRI